MPPTDWVTLVSLLLPAAAAAMYKQWIPNTNFETGSNWDKGRVPCASDVVHFEKNKVSAIFMVWFSGFCFVLFCFSKRHWAFRKDLYLPGESLLLFFLFLQVISVFVRSPHALTDMVRQRASAPGGRARAELALECCQPGGTSPCHSLQGL